MESDFHLTEIAYYVFILKKNFMKKNVFIFVSLLLVGFCLNAQTTTTIVPKGKQVPLRSLPSLAGVSNLSRQNMVKTPIKSLPKQLSFTKSDIKKTLSTKTLKGGLQCNVYELKNGRVVKQLINPNRTQEYRISGNNSSDRFGAPAALTDNNFYEGFEGWDGETWDWIPAGWENRSEISSTNDEEEGVNDTWCVQDAGFTIPFEGQYQAGVSFAYEFVGEEIVFLPTDEWLITPTVTPVQDDNLYFRLAYNPGWILIDTETYEFTAENQKIEVYISTDNGVNWVKKWDVLADASSYSEDELWSFIESFSAAWKLFKINLSEYAGRPVKIAFRYYNTEGDNAYLDAVQISKPDPKASYLRPDGYFYFGYTDDFRYFTSVNLMLGPAFEPAVWYNNSSFDSEEFAWSFIDPAAIATSGRINITDVHPEITYHYARFLAPSLTAYATNRRYSSPVYDWNEGTGYVQTGGKSVETGFAGNYDAWKGLAAYVENGGYIFGTGSENFYGEYGLQLEGIGNYYEKPLHKYAFDTLQVRAGNVIAQADAELTIIIHRVVDGVLRDTIATSTAYSADMIHKATDNNGGRYYTIPFSFTKINPGTGREEPAFLEIEDAILVELKGFTDGRLQSFVPFIQYEDNEGYECNSYVFMTRENGNGETVRSLYSTAYLLDIYSSFVFDMNAVYPFLVAEDNKYAAPNLGGTKNFEIITYWVPGIWEYVDVPDWITLGNTTSNLQTGLVTLPVTVAALPDGFSGRSADIKITSIACDLTLKIKQGDALFLDITPVKTTSTKVVNQGDKFLLSYPSDINAVALYTVTGQKVGAYSLPATGRFTLPVANLTKGVYVLKFTGKTNETVKVIH
jgi:hypothetical protein